MTKPHILPFIKWSFTNHKILIFLFLLVLYCLLASRMDIASTIENSAAVCFRSLAGRMSSIPWTQTLDARPSCNSTVNDQLVTKQLLEWATDCPSSAYLEFDRLGRTQRTKNSRGVVGKATCPRDPIKSPFTIPLTGLVSWPGSGNTWARHLLQQLTGIQSGALYNDAGLKKNGFPGEGQVALTIAVKTHLTAVPGTRLAYFNKQILVIRNPFDAIVAEFKRFVLLRLGHAGHGDFSANNTKWLRYSQQNIREWSEFIRIGLAFHGPQLIVICEDLKSCLLRELVHMANFLKTDDLTKFSLCCALSNQEGKNYRKQKKPSVYDLYSPEARAKIKHNADSTSFQY